ncbi:hypothetical protein LSAT2_003975 [Lamellibrachia satsuma]|nr:hypothetical protein LSAT2_003975 [Lamellibrachia satsuma]
MRDMDQTKRSDRELVAHLNRPKFVTSVCKLVRTLRNVHEHYNHLSPGAKAMFGNTCYPYKFFDREVPKLFPTIYEIIKTSATKGEDWTKREILNMYFTD